MWLKSMALTVWDIIDPIYYACTRLRYIGGGDKRNSAFRVRLTFYKGRALTLTDGTMIQKGDVLLKIHLHNVVLLKDMLPLKTDIKKARFLYRFIERSLPDLALYVKKHPKFQDIKGIIGITMLNRGYDNLGFEAFPISCTWYRWLKWMSLMPICLLSVRQPFKNLKKHAPTYLLMSKDMLLQKLEELKDIMNPRKDYGLSVNQTEVDSDVNEDHHREEQLDDSFEAWYENVEQQVKQKLELTNVPQSNVFDSAKEGSYAE